MIFVESSLIRPKQLRLSELITVSRVLSSRGFSVFSEGEGLDTLIPRTMWRREEADLLYTAFKNLTLRNEIMACIIHNRQPISNEVKRIFQIPDFSANRQAFSHTFEWFVGELLVREFQAFSSSYGVKIKNVQRPAQRGDAGDYDMLSILGDTSLLYIECKTGGFSRDAVLRAIDRGRVLHCSASIMLIGTEVEAKSIRSKLKFEHPILRRHEEVVKIGIPTESASSIYKWGDFFLIDAGESSGDIEPKLRTALRLIAASRVEVMRDLALNNALCAASGYNVQPIA